MNAITVPKNPPTATMGIRTSSSPIRSSRPRSLARSDPLALAVLREQPLGEVHELVDLGQQPLRLAPERDAVLGGLHGHPLLVRLRPSADPLRERLPDRSRQDERGTDDQRQTDHGDRGYPFSHATVSSLS